LRDPEPPDEVERGFCLRKTTQKRSMSDTVVDVGAW